MSSYFDFKLLEFLEPSDGVPKLINVLPFMNEHFAKPQDLSENAENEGEPGKVLLLNLLKYEFIETDDGTQGGILNICSKSWTRPVGDKRFQLWFDEYPIKVRIRQDGIEYLREERVKNILTETSISTRKANESTVSTNKNIIRILTVTLIVSMVNLGIAIISIFRGNDAAQLRILIQSQSKRLMEQQQIIDQQQLLLTHLIAEMKTPKKKAN